MPAAFVQAMDVALQGVGGLYLIRKVYAERNIPDDARNEIAKTALEQEADFVFFMDTDMTFPVGCLPQMLNTRFSLENDLTVMGGVYCRQAGEHNWHVYEWIKEDDGWRSMAFPLYSGLKKVDAIGTGCMLIDMGVFRELKYPWFEYRYRDHETRGWERMSEDMVFCKKCMDAGIRMFAHSDIVCGHIYSVVIKPEGTGGVVIETLAGVQY